MRVAAAILIIITMAYPAFAIKINSEMGFASMFHIGLVSGPGLGLNFGVDGGIPMGDFELGVELEQVITDYNYEVSINATRAGGMLRYEILDDMLWVAAHAGGIGFTVSKDTEVGDVFSDRKSALIADETYNGSYVSISLDCRVGDLILTPRFHTNYVENGAVLQFDLNLGTRF